MSGESLTKTSRKLAEQFEVEKFHATTLIHTETAHIQAKADFAAYEELGAKEYKYLATLDYATCSVCQPLDGMVFKLSEAREGVNYPVMHPRCRCTTTINTDYVNRRARNPLTGKSELVRGDMNYREWIESLTPEQRSALELSRKKDSRKTSDKLQYEQYKKVLGRENMPKSFDKWQELKYNDSEKYAEYKLSYADKNLQNKIRGEYNLTILEGKQGKHILGHNNYREGRSYITVSMQDAQELVNKYAGTGNIDRDKNGKWKHTEIVSHDSIIGVDVDNRTGQNVDTNMFKIHYAKDGVHIVPKRE